jgi:amino acid transporter
MGLKRSIGPMGLMFSAVSGVLGSAWLFSPFYAAQHAGPASIMAWVLGWLAMLLIAVSW